MARAIYFLSVLLAYMVFMDAASKTDAGEKQYIKACLYFKGAIFRKPHPWNFVAPNHYEQGLCSHLIYAYTGIHEENYTIATSQYDDQPILSHHEGKSHQWYSPGLYERVKMLKQKQSDLKILLSIGGHATPTFNTSIVRRMLSVEANRRAFIDSVLIHLRKIQFDGFDLAWEKLDPYLEPYGFLLMKELRDAFEFESITSGSPRLLLTATFSPRLDIDPRKIGYDGLIWSSWLDFINIIAYMYHEPWEKATRFVSPLYSNDDKNVVATIKYWTSEMGVPKSKLVVGLMASGIGWRLADPDRLGGSEVGAPVTEAWPPGLQSALAYHEICRNSTVSDHDPTEHFDEAQQAAYVIRDDGRVWISYENVRSYAAKLDWLIQNDFAGVLVSSIDQDDFLGLCPSSRGKPFPLLSIVRDKLAEATSKYHRTQPVTINPHLPPLTDIDFHCPGQGNYPNPSKCNAFFYCADVGLLMAQYFCPAYMYYDTRTELCGPSSLSECYLKKQHGG